MYVHVAEKLSAGGLVILDGGTGTDIQRRGVPMDGQTWCAEANLSHPDVVRQVHADYIAAGADVVTANTYASSPLLFDVLGRLDELAAIDRAAVRLAREAADQAERPVAVGGSMSVLRPHKPGTDITEPSHKWTYKQASALFRAKAEGLAEAGVDLIMMEMMRDIHLSAWATEAAIATGLPVWVGIAVERNAEGVLCGYDNPDRRLDDLVTTLLMDGAEACLVMHSAIADIEDALTVMGSIWAGPLGAYPESGEFAMPHWQFHDISPADFAAAAKRWRSLGASIVGGCCGIGPDHIRAMADLLRRGQT